MAFIIDIPASIDGSWYDGEVYVDLKYAAFQPSSPLRHLAELYSILAAKEVCLFTQMEVLIIV